MVFGECNCGAITFEISINVSDVFVCHCSICRRSTGSNGIAVLVVNKNQFFWTKGESFIKTWKKPGHDWEKSFCNTCGSTLPGENDETRMYIPAGLISKGAENLKVAHHIWVDSKASWDEICDKGRRHPTSYTSE